MKLSIKRLRDLARKEIETSFEAIKEGSFTPDDILSNTIKTHCNLNYFSIPHLRLLLFQFYLSASGELGIESLVDAYVTFDLAGIIFYN